MTKKLEDIKIDHPDFSYISSQSYNGNPVVVFSRSEYKTPTADELALYYKNKAIVEAHGGKMLISHDQISGKNLTFNEKDCGLMIKAVKQCSELDRYETAERWNGPGCYSFSITIRKISNLKYLERKYNAWVRKNKNV